MLQQDRNSLFANGNVDRFGSFACCSSVEGTFSLLSVTEVLAGLRFSFALVGCVMVMTRIYLLQLKAAMCTLQP